MLQSQFEGSGEAARNYLHTGLEARGVVRTNAPFVIVAVQPGGPREVWVYPSLTGMAKRLGQLHFAH